MTRLLIALLVAVGLYILLFIFLPITQETAVVIPLLGKFEWSFGGLGCTGIFAIIMGK